MYGTSLPYGDQQYVLEEMSGDENAEPTPSISVLPEELQAHIVDMLSPVDVKRFMQTCRAVRSLGRRAKVWTAVRETHRLPPPRKRATKYKTDYDIVTRDTCKLCWEIPPQQHNMCCACYANDAVLYKNAYVIKRAAFTLQQDKKELKRLERVVCNKVEAEKMWGIRTNSGFLCAIQRELKSDRKRIEKLQRAISMNEYVIRRSRAALEEEVAMIQGAVVMSHEHDCPVSLNDDEHCCLWCWCPVDWRVFLL